MIRLAASILAAASLVACSDADAPEEAAQDLSAGEQQLIDAAMDGSMIGAALASAGRFPDGRPRLDALEADRCEPELIAFDRARPAPHVQLDGLVEVRPAHCEALALDRDDLLIMRLDLEIQAGEASAWISAELSCNLDREGELWCRALEGRASLDASHHVELDLAARPERHDGPVLVDLSQHSDPSDMLIDGRACFDVIDRDGNASQICAVY